MANHLLEQRECLTYELLLEELDRAVKKEPQLQKKLIGSGVRDVSKIICLEQNATLTFFHACVATGALPIVQQSTTTPLQILGLPFFL
jgi:hypothetical protein